MTQEDKQLLLKDLSARLPYGVRVKISDKDILLVENNEKGTLDGKETISDDNFVIKCDKNSWIISCDGFKPYLRPMSSMTEEEETLFRCELPAIAKTDAQLVTMRIGLFLKGHLDFNHLIDKGLALEAPEDMYKAKQ